MGKSRQLSNASTLGVSTTLVSTYDANTTSTGFFQVPVGTTAQRPVPITRGYIRYNTTVNALESANGTAWSNVGSGAASSGGGGVSWQAVQNTNFIAVAGSGYGVNTAIANVTVTLPASPTVGQQIQIVDYARTCSSNNLIVFPNGNKIQGNTANLIISTNGQAAAFVYYDANQGWLPYSSGVALGPYFVNYLIVAGGGGGPGAGGGGGAGGMLTGASIQVTPGTQYSISVGAGGSAGVAGTNSTGFGFTAIGGGRGGDVNNNNSGTGGSGGGGGRTSTVATPGNSGTAGQGFPGGAGNTTAPYPAGGGGGAGAAGGTPGTGSPTSGAGGVGLSSSLSGASTFYAGGGGGSGDSGANAAGAGGAGGGGPGGSGPAGTGGTSNTGGGGGGGGGGGSSGGSGIVIVTYTGPIRGSGGTITQSGGNSIHTYTASGTFTA